MSHESRVTRLTMVRLGGATPGVRRYGLARLDEVALATPPLRATVPVSEACLPEISEKRWPRSSGRST